MFCFFCDFRVPARKLASPSSNPMQVSVQVQLAATCNYYTSESVWPGLNDRCSKFTPISLAC